MRHRTGARYAILDEGGCRRFRMEGVMVEHADIMGVVEDDISVRAGGKRAFTRPEAEQVRGVRVQHLRYPRPREFPCQRRANGIRYEHFAARETGRGEPDILTRTLLFRDREGRVIGGEGVYRAVPYRVPERVTVGGVLSGGLHFAYGPRRARASESNAR